MWRVTRIKVEIVSRSRGTRPPSPVETDAKVLPIFVCKIVDSVLMKSKYANIYVCAVVGSNLTLITTHFWFHGPFHSNPATDAHTRYDTPPFRNTSIH